jgi:hypothetical protein
MPNFDEPKKGKYTPYKKSVKPNMSVDSAKPMPKSTQNIKEKIDTAMAKRDSIVKGNSGMASYRPVPVKYLKNRN